MKRVSIEQDLDGRLRRNLEQVQLFAVALPLADTWLVERGSEWVQFSPGWVEATDCSNPAFRDFVLSIRDDAFSTPGALEDVLMNFFRALSENRIWKSRSIHPTLAYEHFGDAIHWAREFEAQHVILARGLDAYFASEPDDDSACAGVDASLDALRRCRFAALSAVFAAHDAAFMELAASTLGDETLLRDVERGERWPRLYRLAHRDQPASPQFSKAARLVSECRALRNDLVHGSLSLRTSRSHVIDPGSTTAEHMWSYLGALRDLLLAHANTLDQDLDLPSCAELGAFSATRDSERESVEQALPADGGYA